MPKATKSPRFLRRGTKIIDRQENKVYPCLSVQSAKDLLPALEEHFATKKETRCSTSSP